MEVYNPETSTSSILHLSASHLLKQVRYFQACSFRVRVHVLDEACLGPEACPRFHTYRMPFCFSPVLSSTEKGRRKGSHVGRRPPAWDNRLAYETPTPEEICCWCLGAQDGRKALALPVHGNVTLSKRLLRRWMTHWSKVKNKSL